MLSSLRSLRSLRFARAQRRLFSTAPESSGGSGGFLFGFVLGGVAVGGYSYMSLTNPSLPKPFFLKSSSESEVKIFDSVTPVVKDYRAIRKRIEEIIEEDDNRGPLLVRLAWHASGTYEKATNSGGSNGATMRFSAEANDGANAGLHIARDLLQPIKSEYPWISYADLWTFAGSVAIESMGGPHIPWRPGRSDAVSESACPPNGRLPDASKDHKHVRDVFYRMGFNDREIVALVGAHTLGRCHTDRSGYEGPWTRAPTSFSNLYFQELFQQKWRKKKWNGPEQYEDSATGELMMLPTDMWIIWDKKFKAIAEEYSKDEEVFFRDFASAYQKLLELGVNFEPGTETI